MDGVGSRDRVPQHLAPRERLAVSACPKGWLGMQSLGPIPDLLKQNLHLPRIPG